MTDNEKRTFLQKVIGLFGWCLVLGFVAVFVVGMAASLKWLWGYLTG